MEDSSVIAIEASAGSGIGGVVSLLHERIASACQRLYEDAHYKHAAHEAMTQVELALRGASLAPKRLFGQRLIDYAFGPKAAVTLRVPLGREMQHAARALFRGAFGYYRNYTAHDGSKIDQTTSARVLVLASELMDLLDASPRSLALEGGPEGLAEHGHFENVEDFGAFLAFIHEKTYEDDIWDGLMEELALAGFGWEQITLTKELGLLEEKTVYADEIPWGKLGPAFEWMNVFELTELGKDVLARLGAELSPNGK